MSFFLCHSCSNTSSEVIISIEHNGKMQSFVLKAETIEKFYALYLQDRQSTSHPVIQAARKMFWTDQKKRKLERDKKNDH